MTTYPFNDSEQKKQAILNVARNLEKRRPSIYQPSLPGLDKRGFNKKGVSDEKD